MNVKKLMSLLFHRTALVAALLIAQIALIVAMVIWFSDYFIYFYLICVVVSVFAVIHVVNRESDPGYKIAWIVPILLFPFFGGLLYLLCGGNRLSAHVRRKMEGMDRRLVEVLAEDNKCGELIPFGQDAVNQSRYMEEYARCPLYTNTFTKYFPLGDEAFQPMLEELRKAEHYIFLEYFIIHPGLFWDSILEILEEKAAQGVDVRVIYDDVGSLFTLPKNYDRELRARGIRCQVFNRFIPVLSVRLNNRDHRKFCIIDGHTAFTGGINLADEYINEVERFGHWKDSVILLKGEAPWSMTVMFLTMWEYISGMAENYAQYRPVDLPPETYQGRGRWVQPYTDSPLDGEPVGEIVYLNLINKATRYVYIMTPYLITSDSVNTALCSAAKSGVDVRIMTPHIPDKKTVFELTRAHYGPLLESGVKIFEYTPGFLHAKTFAVDDLYAVVGSVNLDYRSMFLHFEAGVWMCGDPTVQDVKRDFLTTQLRCQEVLLSEVRKESCFRKLYRAVLRLVSPLM